MSTLRRFPVLGPVAVLGFLAVSCAAAPSLLPPDAAPPVARREPHRLETLGDVRIDDYYWLRERDSPEVLAYLEAENAYTDAVMAPTEALQEELYGEMVARLPRRDESAPVFDHGFWYFERYEAGEDYPLYLRRKGGPSGPSGPEEVVIDGPALAEGHESLRIGHPRVSPDGRYVAFGFDTSGGFDVTIRIVDLESGETLPDEIRHQTSALAWAADDRTLFYTGRDPDSLRPDRVYRHVVGTDPAGDERVYREDDPEARCYVEATRSGDFVTIRCATAEASEVRYLRSDDPTGEFRVIVPREAGHVYSVDQVGDRFYLRIDDAGDGFRLVSTPVDDVSPDRWVEIVPHREGVQLVDAVAFSRHLALVERENGQRRLRILPRPAADGAAAAADAGHSVDLSDESHTVRLAENPCVDTGTVRFIYSSPTTPRSEYDYRMDERDLVLVKRQRMGPGFDIADYRTERLVVPARDGGRIPVSVLYRKGFEPGGGRPFLLYGYGAYGATIDPAFDPALPSLLDRGFAVGVAHVRGGGFYGREWYDAGRLGNKRNTFTDFIDAGESLVRLGYADPRRLYAWGESAGGLLVGAVINMRPDLWAGAVARVPFVDLVTTMLDDSIPLTTLEYDEWGDPHDAEAYGYMLSYSPYDNVRAHDYPHLLVVAGLHDSRVPYWEPAKWVAKLRATKTDDNLLLLRTEMDAGHAGLSGRFSAQRETALEYAFLLELARRRRR